MRQSVHSLPLLGVPAQGRSCSVLQQHVARRIVQEAEKWNCQAIVLGSRRLHGVARLSSRGVREHVLRLTSLPVLVAPTSETNGVHCPSGFDPAGLVVTP